MKIRNLLVVMFAVVLGILTIAVNSHEVLAQEQQPDSVGIIHSIPKVPIIIDGIKMAPEEIAKFNGQELYYLVTEQENTLYIFTTIEGITREANKAYSHMQMAQCDTTTDFYQNVNRSGTPYFVTAGSSGTTFTGIYAFLNNDIESIETTTCDAYTKLFDNTNFTGSQLWLICCRITNDLDIYGWGDRAGSIRVDY